MPKVLLINTSPRKNGNTSLMLREISDTLADAGVDTETISIAGKPFTGCTGCGTCKSRKNGTCVVQDAMTPAIEKALASDGLVIGSPTYFADLNAEAKAFIDRCGYVARANDFALEKKVGAAAVPARRAGSIHAMDSINHMFLVNKMFVAGSSYWHMATARDIGDFHDDDEGIQTMKDLGEQIAWFLERTQ